MVGERASAGRLAAVAIAAREARARALRRAADAAERRREHTRALRLEAAAAREDAAAILASMATPGGLVEGR